MRSSLKPILVFHNFNVAVCDEKGQQVGELQQNLLCLLAEHAERHGYDLNGVQVRTQMGDWNLYKKDGMWNIML
jgi:hypothetical protein